MPDEVEDNPLGRCGVCGTDEFLPFAMDASKLVVDGEVEDEFVVHRSGAAFCSWEHVIEWVQRGEPTFTDPNKDDDERTRVGLMVGWAVSASVVVALSIVGFATVVRWIV